jgi:hypothetical protein
MDGNLILISERYLIHCNIEVKSYLFLRASKLIGKNSSSTSTTVTRKPMAPARAPKASCTLNIEDQTVLYTLQQCPLNVSLNLEDSAGFSLYIVSLNDLLSI